ncbi:MAG: FAD-dependent oxidoreductase, partial [Planctomycetes bacterium]|nr:FAD-dependent oxidoreductase [Planctomycetota bacterium]
ATVFLAAPRPYLGEDLCGTLRLWLDEGDRPETPLAARLFADADAAAAGAAPAEAARGPVRPMHVKKTLDEALLAAKVAFLYGCYATDVLRDARGGLCGIVMANRSGRQAVLAKTIIDATDRALVARLAGAEFRPYPAGDQEFRRVVVGGEVAAGPGVAGRKVGLGFAKGEIIEYTLRLPMADGSWAARAQAEQKARDLTFRPAQLDAAEVLFQVPPDPVRGQATLAGPWPGAAAADLGAFRPAGVERLFVLGGCADVSREAAAALLRPTGLMAVAARIGAAAAGEAAKAPAPDGARVAATAAGGKPVAAGDVREVLAGLRQGRDGPKTVPSPARTVPVLGEYDVVIIGGGTGGAPAGIAAARQKARTLVVEYLNGLGGVGTLGMITQYYHGYRGGFTAEADKGIAELGAGVAGIGKAEWWRRANRTAGAEVWFGVLGCGAFVEGGTVRGAVVATPAGRGVVLAKTVIDATGNADVAAAAGAECVTTGGEHVAVQGAGLPPLDLGAGYTNTDYMFADDTDVVDLWHLFVYARGKFKGAYDLGQLVDTRERRRIVGDVTLTPMDMLLDRTWPDTVSMHKSDFDSHGFTVHPLFLLRPPDRKGLTVYVPLRALMPKGLDGLLVTGLGASAHRDAVPVIRMQPDVQNQGYAAGCIAAAAAASAASVRGVDLKSVQQHLVKAGCLPEAVLSAKDSFPLPKERVAEAVRNAAADYADLAAVLAQPADALPLLREAYASAATDGARLIYAHILGMLGDAAGAETLAAKVRDAGAFDKGWNYTGMGQYGRSLSELDSYIVALGRTRDAVALAPILEKVALLDASAEFSHHRACAMALEALGDPRAARPLAALLAKPGMTGYATTTIEEARQVSAVGGGTETRPRNDSLRELVLARALVRCGDSGGAGRQILERYARDLRGHYARHARAVLAENAPQ